jgi:hypothetical protein
MPNSEAARGLRQITPPELRHYSGIIIKKETLEMAHFSKFYHTPELRFKDPQTGKFNIDAHLGGVNGTVIAILRKPNDPIHTIHVDWYFGTFPECDFDDNEQRTEYLKRECNRLLTPKHQVQPTQIDSLVKNTVFHLSIPICLEETVDQ